MVANYDSRLQNEPVHSRDPSRNMSCSNYVWQRQIKVIISGVNMTVNLVSNGAFENKILEL